MSSPKKRKFSIIGIGDWFEAGVYRFLASTINHLVQSFFFFKRRKGEIVASSVTFYITLSFCPAILLMISLVGMGVGDYDEAKAYVLDTLNKNIPHLAPWIMESIEKIVSSQLSSEIGRNFLNIFVLLYTILGTVSSLIFGLSTLTKSETKGGFVIEDLKSLFFGTTLAAFMVSLIVLSQEQLIFSLLQSDTSWLNEGVKVLHAYNAFPMIMSFGFFTFFFRYATPLRPSFYDCFIGAGTFVACYLLGKSGHWIYLKYAQEGLEQSYGNFYTIFIAVFWVYYLTCSFFYGASVAYMRKEQKGEVKQIFGSQKGSSKRAA